MAKEGKSRKPLLIGVISAVVVLALVLILVLTQCTGGATTPTDTTGETEVSLDLYWNVDRNNFAIVDESLDTTGRKPAEDGFYHVVFAKDGELVELKVKDRKTVRLIDGHELMGLVFDADGVVVDIIRIDDMPIEKVAWQFYVQSIGGNAVKFNSAKEYTGMEVVVKLSDDTKIYDVSGSSEYVGMPSFLQKDDRVMVVANEDGDILYVFVYEREGVYTYETRYCQHCDKELEFTGWPFASMMPTKTGHYFLTKEVNMSEVALLQTEAEICLDLNGYTVNGPSADGVRYDSYRIYDFYAQNVAKKLAIMDSSEGKTGKMATSSKQVSGGGIFFMRGSNEDEVVIYGGTYDVNNTNIPSKNTAGGLVARVDYGNLIIHDGNFDASKASCGYGVLMYTYGGTITINGGTFRGGEASWSGGGAICIESGKLIVNGGTIYGGRALGRDNPAFGNGGAIYLYNEKASMEMNGGTIYGGTANFGGAIQMNYCNLTINGGTIYGGTANKYGGAIDCHQSDIVMKGGAIIGGTAKGTGGGAIMMHCYESKPKHNSSVSFTMYGGTITGGKQTSATAAYGGGNIAVACDKKLPASKAVINLYGGTITNGYTEACKGGGINIGRGILNISGNVKITGNKDKNGDPSNVLVGADATMNISKSGMGKNANVGVLATGAFTNVTDKANAQYFTADDGQDVYWISDENDKDYGKLTIGKFGCICGMTPDGGHYQGCDGTEYVWSPWTGTTFPDKAGYWYLPKDTFYYQKNLSSTGETQNIYLDLNGKRSVIAGRGGGSPNDNRIHNLGGGFDITICDSSKDKTGKVVSEVADTGSQGLFFMTLTTHKNNSINIYGGTWDASMVKTTKYGAMIDMCGGTLNIYDGTFICGESTSSGGGAVCLQVDSVMNMYGGTFTGGKASSTTAGHGGGAIVVWGDQAQFNMYGGTITGNTAVDGRGGGVYFKKGSMTISGDAKIIDNVDGEGKPNNIYVENGKLIKLGELAEGAKIGVTLKDALGTFTTTDNATDANAAFFVSDNDKFQVVAMTDGIMLNDASNPIKKGCVCGLDEAGEHFGDCDGTSLVWQAWSSTDSLPVTSGNYYLLADVTSKQNDLGGTADVKLDLNGKTVTMNAGAKFYTVFGTAHLTVTDSVGTGKVVVAENEKLQGGLLHTWGTPVVDIYGGTLDASKNTAEFGPGISQWNGKINLHGGTIVGGTATKSGGGAVVVDGDKGAIFRMTGGEIIGGKAPHTVKHNTASDAKCGGGSVNVWSETSSFIMTGGRISGGTAVAGGNIMVNGEFVVENGEINGGVAANGGNIYVNAGNVTIDNGSVIGGKLNSTDGIGSNVAFAPAYSGMITLNNAVIADGDGNGSAKGAGLYIPSKLAALKISGNTVIAENISGDNKLNLFLDKGEDGQTIAKLTEALGEEAKIGISIADLEYPFARGAGVDDDTILHFFSDKDDLSIAKMEGGMILYATGTTPTEPTVPDETEPGDPTGGTTTEEVDPPVTVDPAKHCICGLDEDGKHFGDCDEVEYDWTPWDLATEGKMPTAAGKYYLTSSGTSTKNTIAGDTELFIDLNGQTVTMTGAEAKFYAVAETAKLTICDNVGSGKIISAEGGTWNGGLIHQYSATSVLNIYGGTFDASGHVSQNGSVAYIWAGTVNMYGGKIIGGTATKHGGAIYMEGDDASFNLYDGEITGGKAPHTDSFNWATYDVKSGGGNVNVWAKGATFTMAGGKITNGSAVKGGNVLVGGKFIMTGGEITGGTATVDVATGGVALCEDSKYSAAEITVSGDAKIAGNNGGDLHLIAGKVVNIGADGLKAGASIGITMADATNAFVTGEKATGANASYFFSNNEELSVVCLKDQGIFLKDGTVHYGCVCGAAQGEAHVGSCDGYDFEWTAWDLATEGKLPTATGNYYLISSGNSTKNAVSGDAVIALDLNGQTVTMNGDQAKFYEVGGSVKLSICDSVGTGKVVGAAGAWTGGMLHQWGAASVIDIYGGTLDATNHESTYGALLYTWRGTTNMYGGKLIGGKTTNQGGGAVFLEDNGAVFNMYDGEITGGTHTSSNADVRVGGGNVNVWHAQAVFNMYGGKITNGKSIRGGNVITNGIFNMSGGVITGGMATSWQIRGGGVHIAAGADAKLIVSGTARIVDNGYDSGTGTKVGDSSVGVAAGKIITIGEAGLKEGAMIGFNGNDWGVAYTNTGDQVTADTAQYFVYESTKGYAYYDETMKAIANKQY